MEFIIYTVIIIFLLIPLTLGIALLLKAIRYLISVFIVLKDFISFIKKDKHNDNISVEE